jgi:hypothetical protein
MFDEKKRCSAHIPIVAVSVPITIPAYTIATQLINRTTADHGLDCSS